MVVVLIAFKWYISLGGYYMKSIQTREKILQEAEKQFIDKGIHNTQMTEIAFALKINRRTLYRYFPSKDELAFIVGLRVLTQLNSYFNSKFVLPGEYYEDILKEYFMKIELKEIYTQLRFTAEFDRYFCDEYPTPSLEDNLMQIIKPDEDKLFLLIQMGMDHGDLRNDLTVDEIYHFITQTFLALFQRLLLRERHLAKEYCNLLDFKNLFSEIIIRGIKKT